MLINYCTGFISCLMHHCQTGSEANATSLPISYLSLKLYREHTLIILLNLSCIHSSVACVPISDMSLSCHLTFKWRYGWYAQPDRPWLIQLDFLYYSGISSSSVHVLLTRFVPHLLIQVEFFAIVLIFHCKFHDVFLNWLEHGFPPPCFCQGLQKLNPENWSCLLSLVSMLLLRCTNTSSCQAEPVFESTLSGTFITLAAPIKGLVHENEGLMLQCLAALLLQA